MSRACCKKKFIIIPGWGGSHETWKEFTDLASEHFDVHVIDLPCFGDEPCPKEVWGVEEYANFVKSKIISLSRAKSRDPKSKIILGHSFGGQVAAYLAANNPDICEKLILVAASVVRPKIRFKRKIFGTFALVGKKVFELPGFKKFQTLAKKVLYRAANSPDYLKTSGIQKEIYKKIVRQDLTRILPKIGIKTLVVWGTKDKMTPFRHGKKTAALIPEAQFKIIKRGHHGLHHEHRKKLLRFVLEFVG